MTGRQKTGIAMLVFLCAVLQTALVAIDHGIVVAVISTVIAVFIAAFAAFALWLIIHDD